MDHIIRCSYASQCAGADLAKPNAAALASTNKRYRRWPDPKNKQTFKLVSESVARSIRKILENRPLLLYFAILKSIQQLESLQQGSTAMTW